ncbi:hypothetical protein SCHPADRAFT_456215 [Schizopora paradoxa]|uniref:Uncharacterized protein n=1 Tax=Schizopora paradoxa TaxID=27342 RepID=A0A0H2RIC7_9AGAM|nr:hypothetical protein SCHPADRAFT_456215 [Schizopora paradoxa]
MKKKRSTRHFGSSLIFFCISSITPPCHRTLLCDNYVPIFYMLQKPLVLAGPPDKLEHFDFLTQNSSSPSVCVTCLTRDTLLYSHTLSHVNLYNHRQRTMSGYSVTSKHKQLFTRSGARRRAHSNPNRMSQIAF